MRALVFVVFEGNSRNCLANNNIDYRWKGGLRWVRGWDYYHFIAEIRRKMLIYSRAGLHQLSVMKPVGKFCYSVPDTQIFKKKYSTVGYAPSASNRAALGSIGSGDVGAEISRTESLPYPRLIT